MGQSRAAFEVYPGGNACGGPATMVARMVNCARVMGCEVGSFHLWTRVPCLMNVTWPWFCALPGLSRRLSARRRVVYRAAGYYMPEVFKRLGRAYGDRCVLPVHSKWNDRIAHALQESSFVIYQSCWAKGQLDTLYKRASGSWAIIKNGVDTKVFYPEEYPREHDLPIIGSVGAMRYRPRLQVLFDVVEKLRRRCRVVIVGSLDSHCRDELRLRQKEQCWQGLIRHIPFVSPEQLPALYAQLDCLVHPVAGDPCPNVVAEALACGVPVVCPKEGGASELVGGAGVCVDDPGGIYGDEMREEMAFGIEQILENLPVFRERARAQALAHLDISTTTQKYLKALRITM